MSGTAGPTAALPWRADLGDGTYRNPVLHADWSDPDAIRVGDDYYLTASSFHRVPGLPVLHSRDLVNWTIVGHALPEPEPAAAYTAPRHGCGVWAPALRHHAGRFWIFYPDPDHGLYVVTAADPAGPWSRPRRLKAGRGLIDPCPLWDDDGRAYLVHAWARSRAGFNNRLTLHRMSPDGDRLLDEGAVVVDGDAIPGCRTLEGPKLYRRDGWYWIFAPAGGVAHGWQSAFRARDPFGPYEHRIVLAQGDSDVNGPHQGAWVDTPGGEHWFLHFQDRGAHGRVVHLQPMRWRPDDGWPVLGADGTPVPSHRKPATGAGPGNATGQRHAGGGGERGGGQA
ncbi:glycoside hydrolase 43 family protein, partial [Actinomadura kijaniata]|uniref:glycoside hydrolase 43 family protein n=1 Tax=Actinomadura kijaniata TaxID=46161 RepID=UPI003F1D8183